MIDEDEDEDDGIEVSADSHSLGGASTGANGGVGVGIGGGVGGGLDREVDREGTGIGYPPQRRGGRGSVSSAQSALAPATVAAAYKGGGARVGGKMSSEWSSSASGSGSGSGSGGSEGVTKGSLSSRGVDPLLLHVLDVAPAVDAKRAAEEERYQADQAAAAAAANSRQGPPKASRAPQRGDSSGLSAAPSVADTEMSGGKSSNWL